MSREKVIAKVKAMLALAGNNSSEAEAALAAERAHEFIAKHRITDQELGAEKAPIGIDESYVTNSRPWRRYIGGALGQLYFCTYYYSYERAPGKSSGHDRHMFIGRPDNTTVAQMMFAHLCVTVDRLTNRASHKKFLDDGKVSKGFKTSFRLGCATRLAMRLQDKYEASKTKPTTTSTGTTLPALRDVYEEDAKAVAEYVGTHFDKEEGRKHNGHSKLPTDQRAFIAGYEAGDTIGLDQQVENRQAKRLT
jgi:hypothetical protein